MIINKILNAAIIVSAVLALSVSTKSDFITSAFGQDVTPKIHLEEAIKALKSGNNKGAMTHLTEADKGITGSSSSDQTAKMHIDEGMKAVKANDNQGALMHLGTADKALGGSSNNDVTEIQFANGGKVAAFGFGTSNTQQYINAGNPIAGANIR